MAIQSFQLDPNAASYTDDQIIGKINSASDTISRASAVDAAARPIASGEVGATELAVGAVGSTELGAGVAAANLDAMADTARGYIQTNPAVGEFPVVAIHRDAAGLTDIEYDDVAIT